MKNAISILFSLVIMFTGISVASANEFQGFDNEGNACASVIDEDGNCNLIFNNDYDLMGGANSFDVNTKKKVAQPDSPKLREMMARQREATRKIIERIQAVYK